MAYVPTEDFLNSRPLVDFDDETKIIRAETERLMKRIYTSVPHPRSTTPLQIVPYYGHRANDKYNSHRHYNTVSDDIFNMSHYNEPSARTIGRGHLACVSFAGGRGYPRRKHLYLDENRDIQDEIKFRSYYNKNRAYEDAMSLPTGFASYLLRLQPDNRNGTLTSSEKLHITNILKERKSKKSAGDNKEDTTVVMNGVPEKKNSINKFQGINETVIPIEKETKPYKYKSKDPKPNENHESKINGTISSSNTNLQEKTQQNLSEPKPMLESTSLVQPEEKIIEINVEPKVQKENIKSSRKASKTKIQSEETQLKTEIQPKPQDDEKEAAGKEIIAEPENFQEEKPCTQEPNIPETSEVSKEETETSNLTNMVINEFDKKSIINDTTTADESSAPKESSIVTESSVDIDTEIAIESPLDSEPPIPTENPIATESAIAPESTMTQTLSATEKETIDIDATGNICENIGENISENIENKNTEGKEDILEKNSDKNNIENYENAIEIVESNISTTENEVSSNIEQRQRETAEETVFQTRQIIASSTVQETTEVVVTSSQIEIERTQQESANEPVALLEDKTTPEDIPQVTNQIELTSNLEESEELVNTNEIRSEDLLNRLNTEVSAEYSTPREKIIEIEIERPDDLEHIIEEVTDLRSHDAQKESDPEPLIEEPQSPESELIYSKTTANEIHEVLSDVAEEA